MKTLAEYGSRVVNRVEELKELINSGAKFNGTVYSKSKNKSYLLLVYLDGKEKLIAEVEKNDVDICKEEFLNFVKPNNAPKGMGYGEAYDKFGFDFAEEGNY